MSAWTVAVHFLFKSSGNLPAECHGLVFALWSKELSALKFQPAALHTVMNNEAAVCLGAGRDDGTAAASLNSIPVLLDCPLNDGTNYLYSNGRLKSYTVLF